MKRLRVAMIGSVPMSLNEMQLAPAMLAAEVRNRGHHYVYEDINMMLYNLSRRNYEQYSTSIDLLQNLHNTDLNPELELWFDNIVSWLETVDVLLVNVFSTASQGAAYKVVQRVRAAYPNIVILIGGIGSYYDWFNGVNDYNLPWLQQRFADLSSYNFAQTLVNNGLASDCQGDTSLDVLDRWLPRLPSVTQEIVNFDSYNTDHYEWDYGIKRVPFVGSYGCVRRCSFCDVLKSFPKYSYIEADSLTKQIINTVNTTGVSHIQFMDSLVNGSMSNFLQMLKNLAQARETHLLPDDFGWSGTYICRAKSPRLDEIHQYLAKSGVDMLIIGVETGSDAIRYSMDKKFKNTDLLAELEFFRSQGIRTQLLFFPGWPTETPDDFAQTVELLKQLATYSYDRTIDSISFGGSGFLLLEGTPINDNRDEIRLEPGPTNYLWKCNTNPDLTFWESMRRRLVLGNYAKNHGITLYYEVEFLQFLLNRLTQDYELIVKHHGKPVADIMPESLPVEKTHQLNLRFVSNNWVNLYIGHQLIELEPGVQEFSCELTSQTKLVFAFPKSHTPVFDRYESGEYYALNGVYIDLFQVDGRDITLNGFNQLAQVTNSVELPDDYYEFQNQRAILGNSTVLLGSLDYSLHESISRAQQPDYYQRIDQLMTKIKCRLESLGIGSVE